MRKVEKMDKSVGGSRWNFRHWLPYTVIMLVFLLVDQLTKYLAVIYLKNKPALVLIEGVLELQYLENRGVAFSMFQGQKALILITNFMILAVVLFFLFRIPEERKYRILRAVLAVLSAGALGNIIDRIRFDFVVDFISFVLISFPVFNGADCFVVVGTIILFLLMIFVYKEEDLACLWSAVAPSAKKRENICKK